MKNIEKIIYKNQEKIHDKIISFLKSKLNNVSEAYLFGSLVNRQFGKYKEKTDTHEGSDVDVILIMPESKIPNNWKYLNTERKNWKLYKCGKININKTPHRLDFVIVKEGRELNVKKDIEKGKWGKVERII